MTKEQMMNQVSLNILSSLKMNMREEKSHYGENDFNDDMREFGVDEENLVQLIDEAIDRVEELIIMDEELSK